MHWPRAAQVNEGTAARRCSARRQRRTGAAASCCPSATTGGCRSAHAHPPDCGKGKQRMVMDCTAWHRRGLRRQRAGVCRQRKRERRQQLQLIGHGSHVRQLGEVGLSERARNGTGSSWRNRERHQPAFDGVGGVGGGSLHWSAGPHAVCCQAEGLDDQLLANLDALNRPARVCCTIRLSLGHAARGHVADILALQRIKGSAPRAQHAHSSSILRSVCRRRALSPALFAKRCARGRLGLQQHQQHARRHCRAAEKLLADC